MIWTGILKPRSMKTPRLDIGIDGLVGPDEAECWNADLLTSMAGSGVTSPTHRRVLMLSDF